MAVILNASTSSGFVQSADTSGELVLQNNGTTRLTVNASGVTIPSLTATTVQGTTVQGTIVQGTAVASTSGTSIEFINIPSWAKRITVVFTGVSTNGSNVTLVQLGTGSTPTYTDSGYSGLLSYVANNGTANASAYTTGIHLGGFSTSTDTLSGTLVLSLLTTNTWAFAGLSFRNGGTLLNFSTTGQARNIGATLTAIRVISSATGAPSDTFDAGTINIQYEG